MTYFADLSAYTYRLGPDVVSLRLGPPYFREVETAGPHINVDRYLPPAAFVDAVTDYYYTAHDDLASGWTSTSPQQPTPNEPRVSSKSRDASAMLCWR